MSEPTSEMATAAFMLASFHDFAVFPCNPKDKTPLTKHGFKDATKNNDTITRLWKRDPNAMIGVATGQPSGILVLDLDLKDDEDGFASLAELERQYGPLPRTPCQETPSGGRHYFFKMPADGRRIPSRVKIRPGLDTRGDGGYVCIAPSRRADGASYRFTEPLEEVPLADAPEWLLNLVATGANQSATSPDIGEGDVAPGFCNGDDPGDIETVEEAPRWFQRVASAIFAIDNSAQTRDEIVDQAHAIKQACAGDEAIYHLAFEPLCLQYQGRHPMTAEAARKMWDSIHTSNLGWDALKSFASRYGWQDPDPGADFASGGDLEPDTESCEEGKPTKHRRVEIKLHAGELHTSVSMGEQALVAADDGIYCYGSALVRPAPADIITASGKITTGTRLVPLTPDYLRERLNAACLFMRFGKRGWQAVDCPMSVAKAMFSHGTWSFPVLTGFTNCPVFRPDGTILADAGYDAATGLLYTDDGCTYPRVPASPTRDDAIAALALLKALLRGMPYDSDVSRAVALSAILSAIARRAVPLLPLHSFTATGPGQGKSMHADIVAEIAEGRSASAIPPGAQRDELDKQLVAALIKGDSIVSLDNLVDPLGKSAVVNSCLTQERLELRVLGKSVNVETPGNRLLLANGNGLVIQGDLTRRTIIARLDAKRERPELREFDFNPIAMIRADRGRYVAAALNILRAYHVAGRPQQKSPLGGFEEWSRLIRGALIWLGEADPVESMEAIRAADPERNILERVITLWIGTYGDRLLTARELIDGPITGNKAQSVVDGPDFSDAGVGQGELREALMEAVKGDKLTPQSIGVWLASVDGRIAGGHRIVHARDTHAKINRWAVQKIE